MTFKTSLAIAFLIALATLLSGGLAGGIVRDIVEIFQANVIASTAIGLPVLTTSGLLGALFVLQR